MEKGLNILLLGVYGLETVECGGVLCKNVQMGGKSFASIMIASETTKEQVGKAAEILSVEVDFTDFKGGEVEVNKEGKLKLIEVIRRVKPDIIITQDPEHCYSDLDPDRRQAMILILESIALAARDYEAYRTPGLEPHAIATIYYMTPENPNCLVDINSVWDNKQSALDELKSQLEFSAEYFKTYFTEETMEKIVPGWNKIQNSVDKGKSAFKEIDKALHLYQGSGHHSNLGFAEAYRKEGMFQLENLIK